MEGSGLPSHPPTTAAPAALGEEVHGGDDGGPFGKHVILLYIMLYYMML